MLRELKFERASAGHFCKSDFTSWKRALQGLLEEWKAMDRWSLYNLVSRQSDDEFVVGLDRHRRQEVTIKMKYFAYYLKEYRDPTPFQINDDLSQGNKKRLRDDYEVPESVYIAGLIFRGAF